MVYKENEYTMIAKDFPEVKYFCQCELHGIVHVRFLNNLVEQRKKKKEKEIPKSILYYR